MLKPQRILLAIFLSFIIFLLPINIYAADDLPAGRQDFATSYDVVYDIGDDGITTVTEKITLRNLTSQYYATNFKLTIGATDISDIKASDDSGILAVNRLQKDTATEIDVKFNAQVVGLNKQLPWTLQYRSKDFATKQGKIWEISLPKVSSKSQMDNYKVTLSVPLIFGEPTLITPAPKSQSTNFGKMFLTFDKSQLASSGISATFGENQLYDFDLSYHLENDSLIPVLTNIALPPDTNFQDVIFQRITPTPINVTVDSDGNYLAWFRLNRGQRVDVKVIGSAKLYTKSKVKDPILDPQLRQKYLKQDKYWDVDSPNIKATLSEILKDKTNATNAEKTKIIYQYVVNFLKYDTSRIKDTSIERLGAATVLGNPTSAVCMEFTDLFITLMRAAGIPARELDGFAYTSNVKLRPLSLSRDILHAWPQYWDDKRGWVMVDPTWENTTQGVDYFNKLDLNHFVFVIKGISSQQPVPAGSYKFDNTDSKDVKVALSDVDFLGKPQLDVNIDVSKDVLAGFPGKFKIKVSNQGNAVAIPSTFSIVSSKLNLLDSGQTLSSIPAFGVVEFDINFRTKSFFDSFKTEIEVLINNQKFTKEVFVRPFFIFNAFPIIFIAIVGSMGVIYLTILGVLIYRRRIKKKEVKTKSSKKI